MAGLDWLPSRMAVYSLNTGCLQQQELHRVGVWLCWDVQEL